MCLIILLFDVRSHTAALKTTEMSRESRARDFLSRARGQHDWSTSIAIKPRQTTI